MSKVVALKESLSKAVLAAWERVIRGVGSRSDIHQVVPTLAQWWTIPISDPRLFETFLKSKGVDRWVRALSTDEEARYKREFAELQKQKLEETKELISGATNSDQALEFFSSLSNLSFELKRFAYETALESANGEQQLLLLSVLSSDDVKIAKELVPRHGDKPAFVLFHAYTAGITDLSAIQKGDTETKSKDRTDILISICSRRLDGQKKMLELLPQTDRLSVIKATEFLFGVLPNHAFGRFVRLRLAAFLCLVDRQSPLIERAKELLVQSCDSGVPMILSRMGSVHLVEALESLKREGDQKFNIYAAGLIDQLREHHSQEIGSLEQLLQRLAASKSPLIATSAIYALALRGNTTPEEFQRRISEYLKKDKDGAVAQWIADNATALRFLTAKQIPVKSWQILANRIATSANRSAIDSLISFLSDLQPKPRQRYREEMLRSLIASRDEKNMAFVRAFLASQMNSATSQEAASLFSGQSVRPFAAMNFVEIASQSGGDTKTYLVKVLRPFSGTEAMRIMQDLSHAAPEMRAWAADELIPVLLEDDGLPIDFPRGMNDLDFLAQIIDKLAAFLANHVRALSEFPGSWHRERDLKKRELADVALRGLAMSISNTAFDDLKKTLQRIRSVIEAWMATNTPRVDVLASVDQIPSIGPVPSSDSDALEQAFQSARSPHEVPVFLAFNPWALRELHSDRGRRWPTLPIVSEQVVRSFVHFAKLDARARCELDQVHEAVRIDLAIHLRDALSDLEHDLAGYFIFRSMLSENGLVKAVENLGGLVEEADLSSTRHKVIRDPARKGKLRIFGTGIVVGRKVISGATIMKSGDSDDRD